MSKLETKFVSDIAENFFVPSYQRGYRWGTSEVVRLLEDIFSLKGKGGQATKNYCLQPVVVKRWNHADEFELMENIVGKIFLMSRIVSSRCGRKKKCP